MLLLPPAERAERQLAGSTDRAATHLMPAPDSPAPKLPALDLIGRAEHLLKAGEPGLAAALYRQWLDAAPPDPLAHVIWFNCGVALGAAGDADGAVEALHRAIALRPDFAPASINLGGHLERQGRTLDAIAAWRTVVDRLPGVTGEAIQHKSMALKQMARVLEQARLAAPAEEALLHCLDLDPDQRDAAQHWVSGRQGQCKWPVLRTPNGPDPARLLRAVSPLSLAALTDDPLLQLGSAHRYYSKDVERRGMPATVGVWPPPCGRPAGPLRIGYLSSDLREHAVGFLTAEVFGLHDRRRVDVFAYYTGIRQTDLTQARIRASVDRWTDIAGLDDRDAARRIVVDGIDILVDLNGYTRDARTRMLALRPAPIIVNWLGFPGTMGTPFHNYVIADPVVVPPEAEIGFSEKVLRLPCYQANDRQRSVADWQPSRAELDLPESSLVFCCFNSTQKITEPVFDNWLDILAGTPGSVLWLLTSDAATDARLRDIAVRHGIDPGRLVFAPRLANAQHLARYRQADLFLDTFPYGAHTTASDALWMGVPVLTRMGCAFASRVCASLVRAAGLPELVCTGAAQYVETALALGRERGRLAALAGRLRESRASCVLFDMDLLVRRLESLYETMWAEYAAGRLHQPQLANLPLYQAIGCEGAFEAAAGCSQAEYEQRYRLGLAYRDGLVPLPPDGRLWPPLPPDGRAWPGPPVAPGAPHAAAARVEVGHPA